MAQHRQEFPILKMSRVFGVSTSGYYRWLGADSSSRTKENQALTKAIIGHWKASGGRYGSPRIHQVLLGEGWQVSRPRVARLMRKAGIASTIRRKWIRTTDSDHEKVRAPNLLARRFYPEGLSRAWVSDITYLPGEDHWLYLTTVMDLADRKVIGWALSETMEAGDTTIAAFKQAVATRKPKPGMIFHSDPGRQYCAEGFKKLLDHYQIRQSMSRKGNCWDNAPAESFFKTLKYEANMPKRFASYGQARRVLFDYIECWYNTKRLHSALGYRTPTQIEQLLTKNIAA
ncbi:IS3 family transposase [Gracilimonas mengyeensis]|uniref:Transposase InsO and inactivated derivatives n=1 Tax=Gracilimonas mengyeensis TaxID=1302730 RepID=A0A521FP28_9BACT|nr:IS3 family transposase [Gracilimonas mengyeensis]SMO97957.1 Transposase InsO and inactivated derivatives [Gracilimonas mengyeensis]